MPLITPTDAWERLEKRLEPLPPERVARRRAAGRILASSLDSTVDIPAADVSAMDGYAVAGRVAAGDTRPVVGVIAAGDSPGFQLPADAAVRIMTGAPCPDGAHTVVPVEDTDNGDHQVRFTAAGGDGKHIRRRGEVLHAGDSLLAAGSLLTPGALSLLATHGYASVDVHRRPSVSFLTTGDEVVPPDTEPGPGQLRDSHTDFLLAAGAELGLDLHHLGIAPDRPEILERKIRQGLSSDVLLVCGGVSMGEFDFVEAVLERLGCEVLFQAVAIQPGKPLVAARHDGGWLFGLPGNPASVMVTFWLFVRPLVRRLMGHPDRYLSTTLAGVLTTGAPGARGRDRFLPAEIESRDGALMVRPVAPKGSHDQAAYARGTALLRIPAHSSPASAGDPCEIVPLRI
jgi:molybdopterin molybdotransferase